jgi:hypothetical protein
VPVLDLVEAGDGSIVVDLERVRVRICLRAERERKCLRVRDLVEGGEEGMGGIGMLANTSPRS